MKIGIHMYHVHDRKALKIILALGFKSIRTTIFNVAKSYAIAKKFPDIQWMFGTTDLNSELIVPLAGAVRNLENVQFDLGPEVYLDSYRDGLYIRRPDLYARKLNPIIRGIRKVTHTAPITVNTLPNVTPDGLEWIKTFADYLDPSAGLSIHTYRPHVFSHKGFASTEDLFRSIQQAVGDHDWWNTETGWHSAPWGLCKWWKWLATRLGCKCQRTEREIAEFTIRDIELHRHWGCKGYTIYQAFSGKNPKDAEDQFGLLTPELVVKERGRIIGAYLDGLQPKAKGEM
jgi:hypothetical protein